ncbi:MAG TPA: hypothetical protein VN042_05045, partial [Asticcacaulis sp.]|nr:hypothetical protein [Asticcacaulis sp.]
ALALATSAAAQNPAPLTCKDINVPLKNMPSDVPVSISFTPDQLVAQCTSVSGAPLSLVAPTNGVALAPAPGEVKTADFIVKDDKGNTASAKVTVKRQ